jgi:hypothetical protein
VNAACAPAARAVARRGAFVRFEDFLADPQGVLDRVASILDGGRGATSTTSSAVASGGPGSPAGSSWAPPSAVSSSAGAPSAPSVPTSGATDGPFLVGPAAHTMSGNPPVRTRRTPVALDPPPSAARRDASGPALPATSRLVVDLLTAPGALRYGYLGRGEPR